MGAEETKFTVETRSGSKYEVICDARSRIPEWYLLKKGEKMPILGIYDIRSKTIIWWESIKRPAQFEATIILFSRSLNDAKDLKQLYVGAKNAKGLVYHTPHTSDVVKVH